MSNSNYFDKYATSENRTEYKRIMNDIDKATTEEDLNKLGRNMIALHKTVRDRQETRSRASSTASTSPSPSPPPPRKLRRTRRKNRSRRRRS